MPRVTFINDPSPENPAVPRSVEVPPGTSILEAAKQIHAQVGYACGGVCACSTCHVYVKKGAAFLSRQKDREEDILDKAFDVRATSRLGCQARLIAEKAPEGAPEGQGDGEGDIEVEISRESRRAYFDEHPPTS
jgi:2Fe-2S ferredoxin